MNILFTDDAWEDYLYWQQTDKQTLKKNQSIAKRDTAHTVYRNWETGTIETSVARLLVKTH
ncbi:MAG: type II toxin-antitoxin system YoeB family toxin [Methylobacter sp.]